MNILNNEDSTQHETVNISLGTRFRWMREGRETELTGIVVSTGQQDTYEAAILHVDENGSQYFFGNGTQGGDEFGEIIGQLSLEEVLEAAKLGYEKNGLNFTDKDASLYRSAANAGSRTMPLVNHYYPRASK